MLLNLPDLVKEFNLDIRGVIHIGAHFGEENESYKKLGIKNVVFIEPCQAAFEKLKLKTSGSGSNTLCINIACGSKFDKLVMHTETKNGGQSNSLLEPAEHLKHYPDIKFHGSEEVSVMPLDEVPIIHSEYNMINIDVQGYEGEVFKGAQRMLSGIDYIYTEVNTSELYKGCILLKDLDDLLAKSGFTRVKTKLTGQNWGDALYMKRKEATNGKSTAAV